LQALQPDRQTNKETGRQTYRGPNKQEDKQRDEKKKLSKRALVSREPMKNLSASQICLLTRKQKKITFVVCVDLANTILSSSLL
jgi:hypothetical protein